MKTLELRGLDVINVVFELVVGEIVFGEQLAGLRSAAAATLSRYCQDNALSRTTPRRRRNCRRGGTPPKTRC